MLWPELCKVTNIKLFWLALLWHPSPIICTLYKFYFIFLLCFSGMRKIKWNKHCILYYFWFNILIIHTLCNRHTFVKLCWGKTLDNGNNVDVCLRLTGALGNVSCKYVVYGKLTNSKYLYSFRDYLFLLLKLYICITISFFFFFYPKTQCKDTV